ncbi:MAG: serine hydrolase domain-containing protein [Chloroflexota bacterium]
MNPEADVAAGPAGDVDVDAIFGRIAATGDVPGIVYGVVVDGRLAAAGAFGTLRVGETAPPDPDSVFRIASMTKSFTAATVLLLRDEGHLRLDDPVGRWVPELADFVGPTSDSPPITIEHLLTMSAGLPTDDPWGDRQQGLPLGVFSALLRGGLSFAWTPGTRFEYSNLGYGILGRVITAVAGAEYKDVVRDRILAPLGMSATTYEQGEVAPDRRAMGYLKRDDVWQEEPIDAYGALASMGGIFTSVRDLSRWVAGFLDAVPPRDDPEVGHPLSRATRREMQQVHRSAELEIAFASPDAAPSITSGGYGYGLFVWDDPALGRVVGHGGGYPGFGSHMRWHPASGIGVVAVGNARYARMSRGVHEALVALVGETPGLVRRVTPWPATLDAKAAVERLLDRWDDRGADAVFAMNVALDEPMDRRRAEIERLRSVHGALRPDTTEPVESDSPAALAWWLRGERGRVRVEILLDPEVPPRVQALSVRSVPDPPESLAAIAARMVALLGEPGPAWPDDLVLATSLERDAVARALRAAEARFGPVELGAPTAGDGALTATWRARGSRGDLDLTLALDETGRTLTSVAFVPVPLVVPSEAV